MGFNEFQSICLDHTMGGGGVAVDTIWGGAGGERCRRKYLYIYMEISTCMYLQFVFVKKMCLHTYIHVYTIAKTSIRVYVLFVFRLCILVCLVSTSEHTRCLYKYLYIYIHILVFICICVRLFIFLVVLHVASAHAYICASTGNRRYPPPHGVYRSTAGPPMVWHQQMHWISLTPLVFQTKMQDCMTSAVSRLRCWRCTSLSELRCWNRRAPPGGVKWQKRRATWNQCVWKISLVTSQPSAWVMTDEDQRLFKDPFSKRMNSKRKLWLSRIIVFFGRVLNRSYGCPDSILLNWTQTNPERSYACIEPMVFFKNSAQTQII